MAELVPAPFPHLLRRMLREAEQEQKVFDLPARRFWRGADDLDLSVVVHGRRAANPVGPAAGPHGQMAQNVLLSWLAGGRFLELKTVQANDRLTIPRPCIDMETVGYNVEWSQELRLEESLREYVKGSMLIDVARAEGLLGRPDDPARDDTILDLSVGYDLAGVRSPAVRSWIASMKDARAEIEALRREIPDDLRRLRDLDFRTALSGQVTLSTFHGCPAGEIEAMVLFLMEEMGLHVTVKLNPTLLGKEAVDGLLHDVLGYENVETRAEDFEKDLQWGHALEMTDRLVERARALGRELRLKLSNTLVVRNHRSFFPPGEAVMYLSGPPLHVLTLALVERFRRARPGCRSPSPPASTTATSPTASPSDSRRSPSAPTSSSRAATAVCRSTSRTSRSACAAWARARSASTWRRPASTRRRSRPGRRPTRATAASRSARLARSAGASPSSTA